MAERVRGRARIRDLGQKIGISEHLLPPSLLNFVAGLLAGAGINLLTSVATGPVGVPSREVVLDSLVWVVAAVFSAGAAHVAEGSERRADLVITDRLRPEEKDAIARNEAAQVAGRFWILVALAALFVVLASSLIPRIGF